MSKLSYRFCNQDQYHKEYEPISKYKYLKYDPIIFTYQTPFILEDNANEIITNNLVFDEKVTKSKKIESAAKRPEKLNFLC